MSKKYTVTVKVEVSQIWIDDGFDLTDSHWLEYIEEKFKSMLPYAYDNEMKVKAIVKGASNEQK